MSPCQKLQPSLLVLDSVHGDNNSITLEHNSGSRKMRPAAFHTCSCRMHLHILACSAWMRQACLNVACSQCLLHVGGSVTPPEQGFKWAEGEHTSNVSCALQGNGGDIDIGVGGDGGAACGQGAQAQGGGELPGTAI